MDKKAKRKRHPGDFARAHREAVQKREHELNLKSRRDERILRFLRRFQKQSGEFPPLRLLASKTAMSLQAVMTNLQVLEKRGVLKLGEHSTVLAFLTEEQAREVQDQRAAGFREKLIQRGLPMLHPDAYYSIHSLEKFAGLKAAPVLRERKEGRLPCIKVGSVGFYKGSDVIEMIKRIGKPAYPNSRVKNELGAGKFVVNSGEGK